MCNDRKMQRGAVAMQDEEPDHGDDLGPAAIARASRIVRIAGETRSSVASGAVMVRRYRDECLLDGYNSRGYLDDRQWRAGTLFRRRWMMATSQPRVTANYLRTSGRSCGPDDAIVAATAAEIAVSDAIKTLGMIRSAVVISVAGQDEQVGRLMADLKDALAMLADLWEVREDYSRSAPLGTIEPHVTASTEASHSRSGRWRRAESVAS